MWPWAMAGAEAETAMLKRGELETGKDAASSLGMSIARKGGDEDIGRLGGFARAELCRLGAPSQAKGSRVRAKQRNAMRSVN